MLKNRSKPLVLIGITLLFNFGLRAQSIYFNYTDGTNAAYNLVDVSKITFDVDLMNLHMWDGSIYAWNVSTIGYYQYDESSLNLQEWLNDVNAWEIAVFPNPSSTSLNVRFNLPKEDAITIALYDIKGNQILERNLGKQLLGEHHETLDVSNVPQGSYVFRINGMRQSVNKTIIKN